MRSLKSSSLLLLSLSLSALAHPQDEPHLKGCVTRVASPTEFDVDGLHVLLNSSVKLESLHDSIPGPLSAPSPFLGENVMVWGKVDRKALSLTPSRIQFRDPGPGVVSGSAIIDQIGESTATYYRVRADGRILEISTTILNQPGSLKASNTAPASPRDLRTNVWIDYHGRRRSDGVIEVDQASFSDNGILKSEAKLIKQNEYDPATVSEDSHQSGTSKFFKGIDFKQIPPYLDDLLQARTDRIGETLIPAFQRALPTDDPTRIHFRFQLVDEPKWRNAVCLSSGIILVPQQIVRRLSDDSELAAILADNIGIALEKQTYRRRPTEHKMLAAELAGDAAGLIIPGAQLVSIAPIYGVEKSMLTREEKQSGRVALALLHDAGYDITKAPEAWWTLAGKDGEDPHHKPPPPRAVNQYAELATTWHDASPKVAALTHE